MVSLKPFKGTRPFNEDAINIIAPSTDHLSEENIDLISNKNYWNYNSLNPKDPVALNLFNQKDLVEALEKAERRIKREKKEKEKEKLAN